MNSIDVRREKFNAIFRYRIFQRITTLFRFIEICVFLVVISTFSSQLPFSVRVSADLFKGISFAGVSPRYVFVIGNVIVLILLFKSRVNGDPYGKIDVYDEYVKRCEKSGTNSTEMKIRNSQLQKKKMSVEYNVSQSRRKMTRSNIERKPLKNIDSPEIYRRQPDNVMSVECRDGQIHRKLTRSVTETKTLKNIVSPEICSQSENLMKSEYNESQSHRKLTRSVTETKTLKNINSPEIWMSQPEKLICHRKLMRSVTESKLLNNIECCGGETSPEICRSHSEKVIRVDCNESQSRRKLIRSVTDCCVGESQAAESCEVDELSSEAFRRTVEAFIARQQQSLRDEELTPIPYVDEELAPIPYVSV